MYPERNATADLITTIAVELVRSGMEVVGYASQPTYFPNAEKVPKTVRLDGLTIRRLWSTRFGRTQLWRRAVDGLTFFASTLLRLLRISRHAVLLAVTNPPMLPVAAALRSRAFGNPFALVIHDVYPDLPIELGRLRRGGLAHSLLRYVDRFTLAQAHAIVVLGRDMQERVEAKLPPARRNRVYLIPNWADSALIAARPKTSTTAAANDQRFVSNFVVQYSGNVGLTQNLDVLLLAAANLRDERVLFTIVGTGGALPRLKQLASSHRLSNVLFLPRVEESALGDSLAACDAALVSLDERLLGCSVPSKFYGILASGRPVLAAVPRRSEVAMVVNESECGVVVPPGDANALTDAIRNLMASPATCSRFGDNARSAFEQNYTRDRATRQYLKVVSALAGAGTTTSPMWDPTHH